MKSRRTGKQMLVDSPDQLTIYEGACGRTFDVQLDAALRLNDLNVERLITLQQSLPSSR